MTIESTTPANAQLALADETRLEHTVFDWAANANAGIEEFVEQVRESEDGRVGGTFGNFELVETVLTEAGTYTVTAWDGLRRYKFTCADVDELPTQLREIIATSDEAWRKWNAVPETEPVQVLPGIAVWTKGENLVGLGIDGGKDYFDADEIAAMISALQGAVAQLGATK